MHVASFNDPVHLLSTSRGPVFLLSSKSKFRLISSIPGRTAKFSRTKNKFKGAPHFLLFMGFYRASLILARAVLVEWGSGPFVASNRKSRTTFGMTHGARPMPNVVFVLALGSGKSLNSPSTLHLSRQDTAKPCNWRLPTLGACDSAPSPY